MSYSIRMLTKWLAVLCLLLHCGAALGQSVLQSGSVTQGHIATWATNGVIKDGGAVAANQSLMGGSATTTAAGTTIYCASSGCGATVATASQVPFTGTLSNLNASVTTAPGVGQNVVVTVYTGPYGTLAATSLTCTISGTSTSCTPDTAHQVNLVVGTTWACQFVTSGGATGTGGQACSVQFTSSAPPTPTTPFVLQSGQITSGHAVIWTTNGVIQDGGTPVTSAIAPGPFVAGNFVYINNLLQLADSGLPLSGGAATLFGNPTSSGANVQAFTIQGLTLDATPDFINDYLLIFKNSTGAFNKINFSTVIQPVEQMNPGGRLTGASGVCAPTADQAAITILYYSPCVGEWVSIYNGTSMQQYQFTSGPTDIVGLSLTLGSNWTANTAYDVFVTLNSGVVTLCTVGWANSGNGTSSRGFSLSPYKGILTNAASISCRSNNTTVLTVAINQATYLGSFITNANNGQIDLKFGTVSATGGQACFCIWNAYNQISSAFTVYDSTADYPLLSVSWGPAFNHGGNSVLFITGATANGFSATHGEKMFPAAVANSVAQLGINLDTNTPVGNPYCRGTKTTETNGGYVFTWAITCEFAASLGVHGLFAVVASDGVNTNHFHGNDTSAAFLIGRMFW